MQTLNIKDFGAVGNAKADDTQSIKEAVKALSNNYTLYFPVGTYLVNLPGTLVEIEKLSDIKIIFESGAVLLMDNLDDLSQGTGHAFYFKGPAENLLLEGLNVKWKTKPKIRSKGDGVMIDGPCSKYGPSEERTFKNITIRNCRFENTPQTGMILMGCSDINIEYIDLYNTWADGVHLNACRHFSIENISGRNVGDDNVALVTYYNPSETYFSLSRQKDNGPYSQPSLGEWSNYDGTISNIDSVGYSGANGMRIAGAYKVSVTNLKAEGRKAGIIIDAGKKAGTFGWEYQASKEININNVLATQCHVGVHVMSFNVTFQDLIFWEFQVSLNNITVKNCEHDNILIEKCAGVSCSNIESYGNRTRMINLNDLKVYNLRSYQSSIIIHGISKIAEKLSLEELPSSNIILDGIHAHEGNIQIENAKEVNSGYLYSYKSPNESGFVFNNLKEVEIDAVVSRFAQAKGISILNCQQISITSAFIEAAKSKFISLEIGGGRKNSISENISIITSTYKNESNSDDIEIQAGQFAPKNVSIHLSYNTNKKSKEWKHYLLSPH